jgi:hypothetical protein
MPNLTNTVKRAPKWAWYASGGIALGVVGIEVWKRRATDAAPATNDAVVAGTPTGSAAPSPVITPPVIVQPNQDGPDFAGLFGVFGDVLTTGMTTIAQLAQGDQGITQSAISGSTEIARDVIASAGQAPAPASQVSPIIVQVPTPSTPATVPAKGLPGCPAAFPHRSARGCYKCTRDGGKYTHRYQNGAVIAGNKTC